MKETAIWFRSVILWPYRKPCVSWSATAIRFAPWAQGARKLAEELYDVDKVNAHLWREVGRALKPIAQVDTP